MPNSRQEKARTVLEKGVGHICRPGVFTGLSPKDLTVFINSIQKFLMENTRLGIPALVHEECLNGFMGRNATIFPQIIGMASTWEPGLVYGMTEVIRAQMLAVGVRQGLSPVLDVARDPRWGRVEETFGEDQYLISAMGTAYVKGLQGNDIKNGVIATLKHFIGYGKSEGGLNWAPADIPPRMLREVYLYPFKKVIEEAGPLAVMNAYNEIDGIPCAASKELLTNILRDEWKFDGVVVSDYFAVDNLQSYHHVAEGKAEASRLALTAGIDAELPEADCYAAPLKQQIEKGMVSEKIVDLAVARTLRLKFLLGLSENPYVEPENHEKIFDLPEHRKLALEAARKSIVLLKNNDNILPLNKNIKSIAVIGPNADVQRNLLGDYTYPAHIEIAVMAAQAQGTQLTITDERADHVPVPVITILDGITAKVGKKTRIHYAVGCDINSTSKEGFAEAVEAAKSSDIAIVVVGGKSGLIQECTCGEMRDTAELSLPGVQEDLVKAIYETGTPTVIILIDGRPRALGWIAETTPAIIEAWLPGEEGGTAVADVLFGDYNPGGKLPISFPAKTGQIPIYYGHKPSGCRSQFWGDYVDVCTSPAFEFGYGLSYTTFSFSNLRIEPKRVALSGKISTKVDVQNTGKVAGEEVVQLYTNDVIASVTRPVKELKGFQRIALAPAQTKTVKFELSIDSLGFYDKDLKYIVEPGDFKIMIGRSSKDIVLEDTLEVIAAD